MTETSAQPQEQAITIAYAGAKDYFDLLKPRVMSLVVFTSAVGLIIAPGDVHWVLGAVSILAIALGAGASGALNMWYDADIDSEMSRTSERPIPAGLIAKDEALMLGIFVSIVSVVLMTLSGGFLAAFLLAFTIFFYAVIYTIWLKRSTPENIVIGGAAGAFPPVIGWAAATGTAPLDAWLLFAIIFFWTPPHFWALSLKARKDYADANIPMLPVTHGAKETRRRIVIYTLIMTACVMMPVVTGLAGWSYGVVVGLMSLEFIRLSCKLYASSAGEEDAPMVDEKMAMRVFFFSMIYLFTVFTLLLGEALI